MKERLCQAFCNEITVRDVPIGLAVSTIFAGPDGDRIGFYIKQDAPSGIYQLQDSGEVLPHLIASGVDLKSKSRAAALAELQAEYGVALDEDDLEFRIPGLSEDDLPYAAMRFVAFMLRVHDLVLLTETRVASTFREDVESLLAKTVEGKAVLSSGEPVHPALPEFMPDFVVRAGDRPPVGVYLGTSDARLLEALFVQMRARHELGIPVSVVALLEREKGISKQVRQQAMNRLDALAEFRGDEVQSIMRIARPAIGELPVLH